MQEVADDIWGDWHGAAGGEGEEGGEMNAVVARRDGDEAGKIGFAEEQAKWTVGGSALLVVGAGASPVAELQWCLAPAGQGLPAVVQLLPCLLLEHARRDWLHPASSAWPCAVIQET